MTYIHYYLFLLFFLMKRVYVFWIRCYCFLLFHMDILHSTIVSPQNIYNDSLWRLDPVINDDRISIWISERHASSHANGLDFSYGHPTTTRTHASAYTKYQTWNFIYFKHWLILSVNFTSPYKLHIYKCLIHLRLIVY